MTLGSKSAEIFIKIRDDPDFFQPSELLCGLNIAILAPLCTLLFRHSSTFQIRESRNKEDSFSNTWKIRFVIKQPIIFKFLFNKFAIKKLKG